LFSPWQYHRSLPETILASVHLRFRQVIPVSMLRSLEAVRTMVIGRNCEIKTVVDPKIIKIRWAEATRPIRTINHVLMIPSRSARVLLALALYIGIGTGAVQGQKLLDFTKRLFFQSDPMGTGVTYGKLREPVFH